MTLKDKEAIRHYLLKLFAMPEIVVAVTVFFLGFFIRDVALTKANLDASIKVGEITKSALVKVHNLTEEVRLKEISKLKNEVDKIDTSINLVKLIENAKHVADEVSAALENNENFQQRVAQRAVSSLQLVLEHNRVKVHNKEWKLTKKEVGQATNWSALPTDLSITVETSLSTLVILSDISRV